MAPQPASDWIEKLTPEDLNAILLKLQSLEKKNGMKSLNSIKDQVGSKVVKKTTKGAKKTTEKGEIGKRPLNSWMAYRSYYAPIFDQYQQKEVSGFLRVMWKEDPFKARWALLAKAYSVIRDFQGRSNTNLDGFLALTIGAMDIITRENYLSVTGWELTHTDGGNSLVRTSSPHVGNVSNPTMSVDDLIKICQEADFTTLAGQFAANPNLATSSMIVATNEVPTTPVGSFASVPETTGPNNSKDGNTAIGTIDPARLEMNTMSNGGFGGFGAGNNQSKVVEPTQTLNSLDGQSQILWNSASEYPHNDMFHPDMPSSVLQWDPFLTEGVIDPNMFGNIGTDSMSAMEFDFDLGMN
ncbi:MAG: hypothetical protein M1831_000734 [Alyxoria varia]|nr:MAG: hypothetical protein M1831_000734 [Alyxoria varia]